MEKREEQESPPTAEIQQVVVSPSKKPTRGKASDSIAEFSAEALISQGMQTGVPIETLERLLAMRREIKAEQAKEAFDNDMAKMQSAMPIIKKTKEVRTKSGAVAYRYAPLDSIVSQTKGVISKYGFSYATKTETLNTMVKVTVVVKHKLGHSEEYSVEVPLGTKTDIMSQTQVVAAALTFAKRYAFCNAFGILTGDEDTDATPESMGQNNQSAVDRQQTRSRDNAPTSPHSAPQSPKKRRVVGDWMPGDTRTGDMVVRSFTRHGNGDKQYLLLDTNVGDVTAWSPYLEAFTPGVSYRTLIAAKEYKGEVTLAVARVISRTDEIPVEPPKQAEEAPAPPAPAKKSMDDEWLGEDMDKITEGLLK